MKTRCKFVVRDKRPEATGTRILMSPVMYNDQGVLPEENEAFFDATPCGEFTAYVTNEVFKDTKIGDEFYLDLVPVGEDK
jgi:hypothetical protein